MTPFAGAVVTAARIGGDDALIILPDFGVTPEWAAGDRVLVTPAGRDGEEPPLARALRLVREAADALEDLPPEIRDWRPPALFDVAYITPDRLRQRAMQIEARATALVKAAAAAWETLRPFAESLGIIDPEIVEP